LSNGYNILKPDKFYKLNTPKILINLAAKTFIPDSFKNPLETYKTNVIGTLNMLEYSRKKDIKRFVFISSYVYGKPDYLPINEKHSLSALNPYSQSKIIGEELCKSYHRDFGLKIDIIRPFNLYGIGQDDRFLIPFLINQCLNKGNSIFIQNLKPKRDYLYIEDFIDILLKVINNETRDLRILNAGSGVSYSVAEIIELIFKKMDITKKIVEKGTKRKGEIFETVADIVQAKKLLGWKPRYNLEDGLELMIKGMVKNVQK